MATITDLPKELLDQILAVQKTLPGFDDEDGHVALFKKYEEKNTTVRALRATCRMLYSTCQGLWLKIDFGAISMTLTNELAIVSRQPSDFHGGHKSLSIKWRPVPSTDVPSAMSVVTVINRFKTLRRLCICGAWRGSKFDSPHFCRMLCTNLTTSSLSWLRLDTLTFTASDIHKLVQRLSLLRDFMLRATDLSTGSWEDVFGFCLDVKTLRLFEWFWVKKQGQLIWTVEERDELPQMCLFNDEGVRRLLIKRNEHFEGYASRLWVNTASYEEAQEYLSLSRMLYRVQRSHPAVEQDEEETNDG